MSINLNYNIRTKKVNGKTYYSLRDLVSSTGVKPKSSPYYARKVSKANIRKFQGASGQSMYIVNGAGLKELMKLLAGRDFETKRLKEVLDSEGVKIKF